MRKKTSQRVKLEAITRKNWREKKTSVFHWMYSHCNIPSNEEADKLAKKRGRLSACHKHNL